MPALVNIETLRVGDANAFLKRSTASEIYHGAMRANKCIWLRGGRIGTTSAAKRAAAQNGGACEGDECIAGAFGRRLSKVGQFFGV